jgi:hypothetical protein
MKNFYPYPAAPLFFLIIFAYSNSSFAQRIAVSQETREILTSSFQLHHPECPTPLEMWQDETGNEVFVRCNRETFQCSRFLLHHYPPFSCSSIDRTESSEPPRTSVEQSFSRPRERTRQGVFVASVSLGVASSLSLAVALILTPFELLAREPAKTSYLDDAEIEIDFPWQASLMYGLAAAYLISAVITGLIHYFSFSEQNLFQ